MNNQTEIIGRLQGIFDRVFLTKVELTPQLSAADVDEWDSLTQISLLIAVEKEFGVRFKMDEVNKTRNVGDFADLIAHHLAAK